MVTGRSLRTAISLVALAVATSTGCGSEAAASCEDLRTELASITPTAEQAWDDISGAQEAAERALELEAEIAERCD